MLMRTCVTILRGSNRAWPLRRPALLRGNRLSEGTKNIQDVYGLKASVGSPAREERRVRVSTRLDGIFKRVDGPSMGT